MSTILNFAESINIDSFPNIRRSESLNGYVRTEQSGPVFYRITADLQILKLSEYQQVMDEVMSFNYGISTLSTTLPYGVTYFEGDWNTDAAVSSVSGKDITLDGFTANQTNTIKVTDWIQFSGDTKVYQSTNSPIADDDGDVVFGVNTSLIKTPVASSTITRGSAVTFKLQPIELPSARVITVAGNKNLYKFNGPFIFKEVL